MLKRKQIISFIIVIAMSVQLMAPCYTVAGASVENNSQSIDTEETDILTDETDTTDNTQESDTTDSENQEENTEEELIDGDVDVIEDSKEEETENQGIALLEEIGYTHNTIEELRQAFLNSNSWGSVSEDGTTITIQAAGAFAILSQTEPSIYQNATLTLNYAGGGMELVGIDFRGLGSKDIPFQGTLTGTGWALTVDHALFNGLSSTVELPNPFSLKWKGTCDDKVMLASYVSGGTDKTWNVTIDAEALTTDDEIQFPGLLGNVDIGEDTLSLSVTYSTTNAIKAINSSTTDAGLICNTLTSGTLSISSLMNLPTSISITATGNAGGLVGSMAGAGTTLEMYGITMPADTTITGDNGAGGIVGSAMKGSALTFNGTVTPKGTITGVDAGGCIGNAGDLTLTVADGINSIVIDGVNVIGTNVGGVIGSYSCTENADVLNNYLINSVSLNANTENSNAGGLIGKLSVGTVSSDVTFTITGNLVTSTLVGADVSTSYGGLVGSVDGESTTNLSTLAIGTNGLENNKISTNITVASDITPQYVGGLVGTGTNVYVPVNNTSVTASGLKNLSVMFGGAAGKMNSQVVLDIYSIEVNAGFAAGGGVAGFVGSGAAVCLNGTTDLTNTTPGGNRAAQVIGEQSSGLVFATTSVNLQRCASCRYNDIGNYGEVIRLGSEKLDYDLIQVEEATHKVNLKTGILDSIGDSITLENENQFALLAIMIQTEGVFSSAGTVTRDAILSNDITLSSDIDLTGTGIIGLMRDQSDSGTYTGTLSGGGWNLTLSIGEAWGTRDGGSVTVDSEGSGQIYSKSYSENYYYHNRVGLFSSVTDATVKKITLLGNCYIGVDQGNGNLAFGGLSATSNGTFTVGSLLEGVTTSLNVSVNGNNTGYIGGLIGTASGTEVNLEPVTGSATLTNTGTGEEIRLGGLIGLLSTGAVTASSTTLSGKIELTQAMNNAKVGGFIAEASGGNSRNVTISGLKVDGQQVIANASSECGGLLGYEWNSTIVSFDELDILGASSVTNSGNANFGGLVYRANGYWKVNKIALEKASFQTKGSLTSGLLVCHGEVKEKTNNALYLEVTSSDAYTISSGNVSITIGSNKFDELVAYTATGAEAIVNNNSNGVVSIATVAENDNRVGVNTSESNCTTYQNRTKNSNGNDWSINPNSRYYYNLDRYRTNNNNALLNSTDVDTTEKLLLWSVGRYAATNIKYYFGGYKSDNSYKITGALNLAGYSYYPVSLTEADSVSVDQATITFDNATIEVAENLTSDPLDSYARLTSGTLSSHTQHYLMHSGLFYNYAYNGTPTSSTTTTLSVKNTVFSGSVGMTNDTNTSGALLCGNVAGKVGTNCYATMAVEVDTVTLQDLYVNKATTSTTYAPLLMNTVGSYSAISVNGATADSRSENSYTNGASENFAATSLIGRVGGSSATNMSLSFAKIKLEGSKASSIFSRATLLEYFQYNKDTANSGGTYNFNLAEDWNNTSTHQPFNVTYGWEISNSVENVDKQHYYYDSQTTYVNPNTYPTEEVYSFDDNFLPYVADSCAITNTSTDKHELKVNIPLSDLITGCGTYSDPYVITNANELVAVANYLENIGNAGSGWKVNLDEDITVSPCDGATGHATYQLEGTSWYQVLDDGSLNSTATKIDVREYLRNAYYEIGDADHTSLELGETFKGLGISGYAFRGVILGYSSDDTRSTTITISEKSSATGLINYSYGSVVKRVNIQYTGARKVAANGFGGVINHIMGGDNIIDNVTVSKGTDFSLSCDSHLYGVGGYVGIVEGGGVIFRSMTDGGGWNELGDDTNSSNFYQNPFVGRVLDGFAFYEKNASTVESLENTNKNYTIATLDTSKTGDITTEITLGSKYPDKNVKKGTTTVKSAQGLLILSAIASSGAAAGGTNTSDFFGTLAYYGVSKGDYGNGDYGKTRNASYDSIGCKTDITTDIDLSISDDTDTPCPPTVGFANYKKNCPYLVTHYTDSTGNTMFFCASYTRFTLELELDENGYDMSIYDNGYRGIGGRYGSNAIAVSSGTYNADRYTPYILGIECNNNNLTVNQQVKEYTDDTFPAMAVGGLMPFLQQDNQNLGSIDNLTVSGTVSLKYYDSSGNETYQDKTGVGVGGVFGRSANRNGNRDQNFSSKISNIQIVDLTVIGPKYAGGIFGAIGLSGKYAVPNILHMSTESNIFATQLTNCTYNGLIVTSHVYTGGFIGYSGANTTSGPSGTQANVGTNLIQITDNNYSAMGKGSNITVEGITGTSDYVGGLIGYSAIGLTVKSTVGSPIVVQDVVIQNKNKTTKNNFCGSLVGQQVGSANYANWERSVSINNTIVSNCTLGADTADNVRVGGLIGSLLNISMAVTSAEVSGNTIAGVRSGGLLGELGNSAAGILNGSNLLWKDNIITGSTGVVGNWIGSNDNKAGQSIQLAGVSRQASTDTAKKAVLARDIGNITYANETSSYIAYADYTGENNGQNNILKVDNEFAELPILEKTEISLAVGEKVVIAGSGYTGYDNTVVSVETVDGNSVVTGLVAGTAKVGDYNVSVSAVVDFTTIVSDGKYINAIGGMDTIRKSNLSSESSYTSPYYFEGYINSSGSLNASAGGVSSLVLSVEKDVEYQISFNASTTPAKKDDTGLRFRVGYSSNIPIQGRLFTGTNDIFYMSKYDKDFSSYNQLNSVGLLYASPDQSVTDRNYKTNADGYTINEVKSISFPNNGYVVITYNQAGNTASQEPSDITIKKMDTMAATYNQVLLDTTSNPKTSYTINSSLDKTGLVVYGKDSATDGYTQLSESEYSISLEDGQDMTTAGIKTVKVTLNEDATVSATYQIAVNNEQDLLQQSVNVVTSPMADATTYFTAPTLHNTDGTATTLYGDGAVWDSTSKLMIERIISDGTASNYLYTNQGSFSTDNLSTFASSNTKATGTLPTDTIPVLKVSGASNVDDIIKKYLNVVTNGGYTHAVVQSAVSAEAKTYAWDGSRFEQISGTASLTVNDSDPNAISYQTGSRYDNDKMQLTVLAVTFSSGTIPTYTVYVPIVVERILQVDFVATFQNGTIFLPSTYDNSELKHGVLESHGSAITAYLTYQYNTQKGAQVQYGWQSYIDAGGDVSASFDKTLNFGDTGDFPAGTEFLLVDCQNNDTMYKYTVENGSVKSISLSAFKDESENAFSSKSIGEVMNATASEAENGRFVQDDTNSTVSIGGVGYRIAQTEDEGTRYSITIAEDVQPIENYYLVIRTPQTATANVIGAINTEIGGNLPKNINYVARNDRTETASNSNSERTFSLYTGYTQSLAETTSENTYTAISSQTACEIPMSLNDTISYTGTYRSYDMLYQKLQVNLARYEGTTLKETKSFPSGTTGQVTFSVTGGNMNFYYVAGDSNSNGSWIATSQKAEENNGIYTVTGVYQQCQIGALTWTEHSSATVQVTPLTYDWTSDGDTMNLIVGTGNSSAEAVSLSPVREYFKDTAKSFVVNASMDIQMSAAQAESAIPAGQLESGVPDQYVRLNYVSQLSSIASSLDYTLQRAQMESHAGYYLNVEGKTVVNYKATDITQLGINLGSPEEQTDTHEIYTNAEYILGGVEDLSTKLAAASAIRFNLTIERRNEENRQEYLGVEDGTISLWNKVVFGDNGAGSNTGHLNSWTYDLSKDGTSDSFEYYNEQTKTLTIPINITVNTALREMMTSANYFANYRAKLQVSMIIDGKEEFVADDYITYTITNITPEFLTPTTVPEELKNIFS